MSSYVFLPINIFLVLQISCFGKAKTCCDLNTVHRIHNFVSLIFQWYHCAIGVLSVWHMFRNYVIYRCDWLSIKFCGNDSFGELFLFFENTFQYLGGISKDISVFHFGSCRSLSPANRRRSTSPILFLSFTQPCDQHDRKIPTICKSAAQWRGRRARGYSKLILRANLLYVPNIKM